MVKVALGTYFGLKDDGESKAATQAGPTAQPKAESKSDCLPLLDAFKKACIVIFRK